MDLWWFCHGNPTRAENLDTMNEYNEFFRFDEHSHLTSFIVHLATLFDRRSDAVKINEVLVNTHKSHPVRSKQFSLPKNLPNSIQAKAKKLLVLRHEAFVHRSKYLSYNDVFKSAQITSDELFQLTNETAEVLNLILKAQNRPQFSFWELHKEDQKKLLADLGKINGGSQ